MALEFTPLKQASDGLIEECIQSVLDVLPEDSPTPSRMWARVEAAREGHYPVACDLLTSGGRGVGWVGWFPLWINPYSTWSSATYLAAKLRGRGLVPVLRCWQAHAAETIVEELGERVEFVSSIDTVNLRSLRASLKYAKANGWANDCKLVNDSGNDRMMLHLVWPAPPAIPHECFIGRELPLFEEVFEEPAFEFLSTEIHSPDFELAVDESVLLRYQ